MDVDHWGKIESAFAGALELQGESRDRFLENTCGGDRALYSEVLELLASAETAEDYFSDLALQVVNPTTLPGSVKPASDHHIGRRIGNYRLGRLIGRGGMGAVYFAERDDQQFDMCAAVKLLPLGLDSSQARSRFLSERQILAGLKHPGIARLIDGGVADDGTPYFVMEHVDGRRIDSYCDEHRLGVRQRIDLFLRVCEAVQYAHRNLIVHRDLKPTNILVTETGEVKLLDFGIARVLDMEGAGETLMTGLAHPMTLAYASPEQVRREPFTTACDVYALGVLLYVLLSGRHPYTLAALSTAEVERTICEIVPEAPSAAISHPRPPTSPSKGPVDSHESGPPPAPDSIAHARDTPLPRLIRELRGDLDAITMTALRKEPERRYASVTQLADDLRRYESGLTVSAHRDTLRYRVSRFVTRHRGGVAAAAAFMVLITALAIVSTRFAITATAQSRAIAQEAATADEVTSFLIDLFQVSDPREGAGDTVRARAILDQGARSVEEGLASQPAVQARMMSVLGQVYRNLGLFDDARRLHEGALAARRDLYGSDHLDVAESAAAVAGVMRAQRYFVGAEPLMREALEIRRRLGDEPLDMASTLESLALVLRELDQADSAAVLMGEVLATRRQLLGDDHFRTVGTLDQLAYVVRAQGLLDSAEVLYREAIPQLRLHGDSGAAMLGPALNNLAYVLRTREDHAGAEVYYREAVAVEKEWGVPPTVALLLNNLASALHEQGKYREAEAVLSERISINETHWPGDHWQTGMAYQSLGIHFIRGGDTVAAGPSLRRAVEIYSVSLGAEHGWTGHAKAMLATSLMAERRFEEAEQVLLDGYETLRILDESGAWTVDALTRVVFLYRAWGRPEEADRYQAKLADGTGEAPSGGS